jgi:hypothetical protein
MLTILTSLISVLTGCSLPYKVEKIDISKNTQKEEYVLPPVQMIPQNQI